MIVVEWVPPSDDLRWLLSPRISLSLSVRHSSMAAVETRECETEGCSSEAKLQCPTCIKLGIQGSYFCSQVKLLTPRKRPKLFGLAARDTLPAYENELRH